MIELRKASRGARRALMAITVAGWLGADASACPFCSDMGKSLTEKVNEAGLVVYGKLSNSRVAPNAEAGQPDGTTDMEILAVLKDHAKIHGQKKIVLPRYIYTAEKDAVDYLVFAEVIDDRLDPYQGVPVDSEKYIEYIQGALKQVKEKPPERLGFFFKHLDNPDLNVASDAYKEFALAPYRDVVAAAGKFDPDKIIKWIHDPNTPSYQIGLYGCLLGVCGRPSDADVLRKLLDDREARPLTGVDGLMGGYCILDPKNGPAYVLDALVSPNADFSFRWAALHTVRFIFAEMPQVDRDYVYKGLEKAIQSADISDLVIDEFRKNKVWTPTERILALYGNKDFDLQVVKRAIIRYALKCPDPKAQQFIERLRKDDPQLLADVQEILKYEEAQEAQLQKAPKVKIDAKDAALVP